MVGFIAPILARRHAPPEAVGRRNYRRCSDQHSAPGRFAQLDQNLDHPDSERQPGGVLAGIFVDDRRDPKELSGIVADHGTVRKTTADTFLDPRGRNLQRFEPASAIRRWWRFGRYAFDMSKFSNQATMSLGIRERYLWELLAPRRRSGLSAVARTVRAELHEPFPGAALSVRVCSTHLRVSRRAAHDPQKPQFFDWQLPFLRFSDCAWRFRLLRHGGEIALRPVIQYLMWRPRRRQHLDHRWRRGGGTRGCADRSD